MPAAAGGESGVMLGASFVGDGVGDALDEGAVPRGAEADDLGEDGGAAIATDAVAGFVPPIVGGDAETRDGVVLVEELVDFLRKRETGDEVADAGRQCEGGIEKRKREQMRRR